MTRARIVASVLLALVVAAAPAQAQENLYPGEAAFGGVDVRSYSFGNNFGIDRLTQVAFPVAVVVPIGKRFSFDVGASYAITHISRPDSLGGSDQFSHLTDTQLRGSYIFGNDAVVASVMVNLPSGVKTTTLKNFNIVSSASSNFLLFPVNSYGSATSVTPGLAAATQVGQWNVGASASVRISAEYTPFSDSAFRDSTGQLGKYKPGVETRFRLGADRLLGQSRFNVGLTFSTFSNDALSGGGFAAGNYNPGNRLLADLGVTAPLGSGTASFYAWDYYRSSAGSAGSGTSGTSANRENILTLGVSGSFPAGSRGALEPLVEARIWSPESGSGRLFGAGVGYRVDLGGGFRLVPAARVDLGTIKSPLKGSNSVTGIAGSLLARYEF
jgi:hypothetical protein